MGRPKKRQRTDSPEEEALFPSHTQRIGLGSNNAYDMSALGNAFPSMEEQQAFFAPGQQGLGVQDGFGGLGQYLLREGQQQLTPDTSQNNTPPNMLNLPAELQDTTRSNNHARVYSQSELNAAGTSTAMLLNPSFNMNSTFNNNLGFSNTDITNGNNFNTSNCNTSNGNVLNEASSNPGMGTLADMFNINFNDYNTNAPLNPDQIDTNNQFQDGVMNMFDIPMLLENDANLGMPPIEQPKCNCLNNLYLHLSSMIHMKDHSFPIGLHTIRHAMQAMLEAITCEHCPQTFLSGMTNTQLLGSLLMAVGTSYCKILQSITAEAKRADDNDENKKLRLADLNTTSDHLHTGGLGCAAAFTLDLTPTDWKAMAKKVVRAEVYGPQDGNDCCVYYIQLVEKMEKRHTHFECRKLPDDFPVDHQTGMQIGGPHMKKEDHLCFKLAQMSRKVIEGADWSALM
jgi:hypothetical protein